LRVSGSENLGLYLIPPHLTLRGKLANRYLIQEAIRAVLTLPMIHSVRSELEAMD